MVDGSMKNLPLFLLIFLGLINTSFAGVKDISIICEDIYIYEDWQSAKPYQTWYLGAAAAYSKKKYSDSLKYGNEYISDLIIIGDSNSSVILEFSSWLEHSNILNGKYKLVKETLSEFWFEKQLKLGANKGKATIFLKRDDGSVFWSYSLDVDKIWKKENGKDTSIIKYRAGTPVSFDCKKYKRIF